jgi:hypothetical protein
MDFRILLRAEFERRRARNPRYSLRAFARHLATHHSAITRILDDRRRLTPKRLRALGERLGLTPAQIRGACLHEQMELIASLVARPGFRPDSRWIATRSGLSIDDVNVALHLLVHSRRITMTSSTTWTTEHSQ